MPQLKVGITLWLWALCSQPIFAATLPTAPASPALDMEISLGARYFSYYEYSKGNDWLDRETGVLPLLGVAAQLELPKRLSLSASWQGAFGTVAYDGQTQSGVPHQTDTHINENHLQTGLDWQPSGSNARLGWLLGFYQRERHIQARHGVSSLREVYRWGETGLQIMQPLTQSLALTLGVVWTFAGDLKVELPQENAHIDLPAFRRYHLGLGWVVWQRNKQRLVLRGDWRFGEHRASEEVPAAGQLIHEPAASLGELDMSVGWVF